MSSMNYQFAFLRKLAYYPIWIVRWGTTLGGKGTPMSEEYRSPGQFITVLLAERGWTKRVLAIVLGMDETGVNRLAADKRPVDAAMALTLEEVFGVPAE